MLYSNQGNGPAQPLQRKPWSRSPEVCGQPRLRRGWSAGGTTPLAGTPAGGNHLLLGFGHRLQEVAREMDAAALPGAALEHAAHGLGQTDVGIGDHQPDTSQTVLFEAGEELPPEGLALAVAHLEPQQSRRPSALTPMAATTAREQTCSVLPSRPWK
jgi:hypothetical protein